MRYGGTPEASGRAKNRTPLSPNPLLPGPPFSTPQGAISTHQTCDPRALAPIHEIRTGSAFLSYLYFHSAGPGCAVDKPAELEGIFLQHIIQCLPVGLHM